MSMRRLLISNNNEHTLASCFSFFVIFDDNKAKIVSNNNVEFGLHRCLYPHFEIPLKCLDHVIDSSITNTIGNRPKDSHIKMKEISFLLVKLSHLSLAGFRRPPAPISVNT